MQRYYFSAQYKGTTVDDSDGEEFANSSGAREHAIRVARELACNTIEDVTVFVSTADEILAIVNVGGVLGQAVH